MSSKTMDSRREFLFLYDIKMGNPNGDPDENRPRVLPDGTYYVTDVRLKRFVRDFLKTRGKEILVDNIEGKTTNLTGRVVQYLTQNSLARVEGRELVNILLDAFVDARMFGSSLAFKAEQSKDNESQDKEKKGSAKKKNWEPKPEPKTLTGPIQMNMGEVLHRAKSVDIHGTSVFASDETKSAGTFTTFFGLRYALIGFSGVANEHTATLSRMTNEDYSLFLKALWHGVRSAANTRTKVGQIPRLLISIEYKTGEEYQIGRLHDYVKLIASGTKQEDEWSSPEDYLVDLSRIVKMAGEQENRIDAIKYALSEDISLSQSIPDTWCVLPIEDLTEGC
jgi:CRISPR-associated protein Csh2